MIKKQTMIFAFGTGQVRRALDYALEHGMLPLLEYKGFDKDRSQYDLIYISPATGKSERVHITLTEYVERFTTVEVTVFSRVGSIDWDSGNRLISDVFNAISAACPLFS